MSTKFDVIIIGSGPAGVSAAFPLLEAGLNVLMIDGGKVPDMAPPEQDFLSARRDDFEQWKWMIGQDFCAIHMRSAVSPKFRVPSLAFTFDGFEQGNNIKGKNFVTIGSLAAGGLSNAWGCGVARFSSAELAEFPSEASSDMERSYEVVSRRIGISGKIDDDMSDYFKLDAYAQPPIPMDPLHASLATRYATQRTKLRAQGFRMGRSRVAALSEDVGSRKACNLSGNCLWGCRRRSLYSAADDLLKLHRYENFSRLAGFLVDGLTRRDGSWNIEGQGTDGTRRAIVAKTLLLAAGTLATTRLVLSALKYEEAVPVQSSPMAVFALWLPRFLATQRVTGFGLGQLSFAVTLAKATAFGSTFSTTGLPVSEFARHLPWRRRYGIDILSSLLGSCLAGNVFLPGNLTAGEARLQKDGALMVSGAYRGSVMPLMKEAADKLRRAYRSLGAFLLPGSFTIGAPGGDIHYAGTLPMRNQPAIGEISPVGEVLGLEGVYVVDGACLPILPEKSHTLTIMANADRIGRKIAVLQRRRAG
ncbi:dehydrogenase [Nitrospira sp.]|nr:dehydrogenase [Nitrospira sp.]